MEIVTSLKFSELEQLITESVRKCLNGTIPAPQPEPQDRIGIDEACILTGYRKATIYKKSFAGEIPCERFGKRLIFSRSVLIDWMNEKTINRHTAAIVISERLAEAGKKHLERVK